MVTKKVAKEKGARIQRAVAEWYQRVWPAATTQGAGTPGRDVLNVPVSIEVKARRDFSPQDWVRQAMSRRRTRAIPLGAGLPDMLAVDEFPPWVVCCPFGMDAASVADFMVIQDLTSHTELVQELVVLRRRVQFLEAHDYAKRTTVQLNERLSTGRPDGSQEAEQA